MGRSQRHMILEQGAPANGEAIAEGQPSPAFIAQATEVQARGGPLSGSTTVNLESLEPAVGPPGGPLQGSTVSSAVPVELDDGSGPEPEPSVLTITSPTEGATVPPVHDIVGTGAPYDTEVELVHEDVVVSTTTSDGAGDWGFTGDTPAALGPVTWGVRSGGQTATVNITVEEEAPVATSTRRKKKS